MPPYHEIFKKNEIVKIKNMNYLTQFQKNWKYHHTLTDEQIKYAGKVTKVKEVSFYHGGDALYEFRNVPGIWHEELVEENLNDSEKFIPASAYYKINAAPGNKIEITGKEGESKVLEGLWGTIDLAVESINAVANLRSKNGFEKRYFQEAKLDAQDLIEDKKEKMILNEMIFPRKSGHNEEMVLV